MPWQSTPFTLSSLIRTAIIVTVIGCSTIARGADLPVFLGLYPNGGNSFDDQSDEIVQADSWLASKGIKHGFSIAATFISLENKNPTFNIPEQLEAFWEDGYIPFVNIMTSRTMADIANGSADGDIKPWIDALKQWLDRGDGRKVFIAPFPEMNGDWPPYGEEPTNFKKSFVRLQDMFEDKGILDSAAVSWVFAPNGWSKSGHEFERYYPGDPLVDVVGVSAYNFGYCPIDPSKQQWDRYDKAIKPFLDRMRAMAPSKPIFLTQTGTVKLGPNGFSETLKDEWLVEVFSTLSDYPGFRGVLYFNKIANLTSLGNCSPVDFRIHKIETNTGSQGLADALENNDSYGDWENSDPRWDTHAFPATRPTGHFADVWPADPFSGNADIFYFESVEALKDAKITGGCGIDELTNMPLYCPDDPVSRDQVAVFLGKGVRGSNFTPPPASGTVFNDVSSTYWAAAWIEQFADDGITKGCATDPPRYCPTAAVTRAQVAVFLERAKHWPASFVPQAATGTMFDDVPIGHWAVEWIEELARDNITGGCATAPPRYCPESAVTRGQMAVFIANTFGLP